MRIALMMVVLWIVYPDNTILAQSTTATKYVIQPGDSWQALAWRFNLRTSELQTISGRINLQRQPTIGSSLEIPIGALNRTGRLIRSKNGGMLQTAVELAASPWQMALQNGMRSPYRPLLMRPLFVPGGTQHPKELPPGLDSLELSQLVARPGQAIAFRALAQRPLSITVKLNDVVFDVFANEGHILGLAATGAFFGSGEPELTIRLPGTPLWSQPWRFADRSWEYQQITLTGAAAAIDQQSIAQERARLFELWSKISAPAAWIEPFRTPVTNYLEISSAYGVRRSYNGGPYRTYHEGVDFAAYGGTPVYAPAAGTVILAEELYVRGNAAIIDHGLGVFTGYYHLSGLSAEVGEAVQAGDLLGEVGTTGLSTGNHLHWDLLVADTWVDAASWLDQNLACWILEGLGESCDERNK